MKEKRGRAKDLEEFRDKGDVVLGLGWEKRKEGNV